MKLWLGKGVNNHLILAGLGRIDGTLSAWRRKSYIALLG
jgi:hypothetical protein